MPFSGSTLISERVERNLETEASPEAAETYQYWKTLLPGDGKLPRWRDFDWSGVPIHVICCCGVVDVVDNEDEFVYRFWGTKHVAMHDQELTNKPVHEMRPTSVRDNILAQYRMVREEGKPRLFTSIYRSRVSTVVAREYSLRLPFSDDGERITHIFALSDITEDFEHARKVCEDPGS